MPTCFFELKRLLDRETSFMMLEPDELEETAAELAARLQEIDGRENCVVAVAADGSSIGV